MKRQKMNLVKQTAHVFAILLVLSLLFVSLPVQALADEEPVAASANIKQVNGQTMPESKPISPADRIEKKLTLDPARRKLSGKLTQLVVPELLPSGKTRKQVMDVMKKDGQLATAQGQTPASATDQDIFVYIYLELKPNADISLLEALIHEMTDLDEENDLMAAWVSLANLERLAAMDQVRNLRLIEKPRIHVGSVTSEGDSVLQADLARLNSGQDGTGVKIGIISDGVDNRSASILSGDLPPDVVVLSNMIGGDEGTAMLEIVHDLAPGAQLYFHDHGNNHIAFNQAIDDLVNAGCDIICDDIGWITEPFFEDGIIADHVSEIAAQNQVLFVSSAGNAAEKHYQGVFYDDGLGEHDFSHGSDPIYKRLYIDVPSGGELYVSFQWNEAYGSASSDYDLYLLDLNTGLTIESSQDDQTVTANPSEVIAYTNTSGATVETEIVIFAYGALTPRTLEVYLYGYGGTHIYSDNMVGSDSIFGHAAVPAVIACGAINEASPALIESFSSQGPVTMINEVRQKPDLCGVDGVVISGAGGFGSYYGASYSFYGTSAAAPHVAAVAALVLGDNSALSPAQVKEKLVTGTVDLGSTGFDPVYGNGRVDALASVSAFTVSFQSNGGSHVDSQMVDTNALITKPANPTRTGFSFAGWFQDEVLTDTWDFASDTVTGNITLYAKWTIQQVTVTFNKNGGNTEPSPLARTVNYNEPVVLPTPPTKTGYSFIGWNTKADGTGAAFTASTLVQGNLTVYACWLQIPINVKASSTGYNSAKVTWSAVAGASGYDVYRKLWSTGTYILVGSPTTNSLTNTGLVMGKTYYYQVRAYRLVGSIKMVTAYSRAFGVTPALSAPTGLKVVSTTVSGVKISWTAVAGASGYVVERRTWSTGTFAAVATPTTNSLNNTGLSLGKTYYYRVRAYRLVGSTKVYSPDSTIISAAPALWMPTGLSAVTIGSGRVKVAWTAVEGATAYEVYRKLWSTGTYALVATPATNSLTNTGLANNKTYYYYVRAYRLVGTTKIYSKNSTVVAVTIIPATPVGLKVSATSYTSATISWTSVVGAIGYEVYRKLWSTGTYVLVASPTTNSLTNTGLATGKSYYYYIRSFWTVGTTRMVSKNSTVVMAVPTLAKPVGLKATASIT